MVYAFKKASETEITLVVYYGNDHYDFGVVFRSVVNDKEHSPCVTMKYPPKDKYEFIHIQDAVGMISTSLLGDYKEWKEMEIDSWLAGMLRNYEKLTKWRLWISTKFKELESSLLEPDWNIVAAITKEIKAHSDLIFKPGHVTCEDSPEDEREG
jgi:hypothetical protein